MGKNGSGKSTLVQVLAGRETYEVTGGTVTLTERTCWSSRPRSGPAKVFFWRSNIPWKSPA